ncbi:protein unc-13 homolog 4B-like [Schistocerca americana]|uniref:protein unc-13 homolog 4B-like n=1 Tax=Schistocerca americana TaxID=7009 RepID=UPI001F4F125A|nr:protein unc-13 homolog 4B-like [Schistocerca americana]XP_049961712.1 protein unc-13 homolog 4B-like [Schistocerca serialis cubense]
MPPSLLSIWKKILSYVLCGCPHKKDRIKYAGYYNANNRTVTVETPRSGIQRNSKRFTPKNGRRKRIPSQDESCAGTDRTERCISSSSSGSGQEPDTWELFNLHKMCEVSKNGKVSWLDISLTRIMTMIETAIRKDTLKPIDNDVKYTSSALDMMELFYQLKRATYKQGVSYKCAAKMLDDFCRCVLFFIDEITKKIKSLQEADESNRPFKVSPEMCSGINSSEYVYQSLAPFVTEMKLEEILWDLGSARSETFASQWYETVSNTVDRTSESAQQKVLHQLDSITERMEPTIKKLLLEESKTHKSQHCEGLVEYLSQNFLIMHLQLHVHHFEHMLTCVWNCSISSARGFLNGVKKNSRCTFNKNISAALQRLQRFLIGLDERKKVIFTSINDLLAPELIQGSSECIHRYHLERMSQQNSLTSTGLVAVKMWFLNNVLNVEILNARDIILPPKKSNANCNAYIKMQLLPTEKYKSVGKMKTKVQRNTLYPIFDETFNVDLTTEQCNFNNAVIRFTLKSSSIFTMGGTFLGETFVLLSQIPSLSEYPQITVQQQLLRLTRPISTGSYSFQALKGCKSEKIKKFMKKEKLKLKQ